ncbi:Hsp70 family protein [Alienimonas californiensis]|uniref:Chaperone protein DnaK n=1 Tax=Alienimonas californiensis TaxID=2527989 RepID=A0A517PF38_9PLAN|nr:Hsp70 family protein [Alienimonas californiensis]QDT17989.1 Chaperone protein DnaK [Alienimonas californiensis]
MPAAGSDAAQSAPESNQRVRRIGIDLGTTFSSLAALDRHGNPVSVPNAAGELATPSVVLFEPDGKAVVGTEAARRAISAGNRVVQQAKRFLSDPEKSWDVGGRSVSPTEVSALILRDLLRSARTRFGAIEEAVVTVPVQFGDAERRRTVVAAKSAGLQRVTLIDEPVAAALCHILAGSDAEEGGLWFTELAAETTVLVFDLGGGTLDLAVVEYGANGVKVKAAGGDPELGGVDFTAAIADALAGQFARENAGLGPLADPRNDPDSEQALLNEAEEVKRSLSVREATQINIVHAGRRRSYKVERGQFEALTAHLVARAEKRVTELIREHTKGWGQIDAVLLTGGSTRIPAVRAMLKRLAGTTPSTELSPDQSVAHGACLYAGLLSRDESFAKNLLGDRADTGEWRDKLSRALPAQRTGRGLGILVREVGTNAHVPHYLIPPNSTLPASATQAYGTVRPGQRRVRIRVVQAGPTPDAPPTELGDCIVEPLPEGLPENAAIAVTLSLDASGLVHTTAVEQTGGVRAETKIVPNARRAAPAPPPATPAVDDDPVSIKLPPKPGTEPAKQPVKESSAEKPTKVNASGAAPPPPAPGRTGKEAVEGESEFWNIVAPEVKKQRRRRQTRS